jgi:hypothetical protein
MTKINFAKTACGIATLLLCVSASVRAQQPVIPLYSGVAPGSENAQQKEVTFVIWNGKPPDAMPNCIFTRKADTASAC